MRRWLGIAVFAVFAVSAVLGVRMCPKPASEERGPLILGTIEEPDTLDPVFTQVAGAQEIVRLLFRDLTTFDETWSIVPELAASMPEVETTTAGAPRVRWTMKPGLKWSDGRPLTTDDVLFGHRITSDPRLESVQKQITDEILRLTAVSPLELLAEWRRPYPDYAVARVHPALPRHSYPDPKDSSGGTFRGLGRTPISSGPYRLKEWRAGEYLALERNPYWQGVQPAIENIVFRFFRTEDTFEAELKTGGIHALGEASGLSLERAQGIAERLASTHAAQYTDSGMLVHMATRSDHPATGDLRVRRALALAIDREAMAKVAYGGRATPAYGCFPPRHAAHRADLPPLALDRREAERLLDEAGWKKPPASAVREKDGQKLSLTLQFASGSQASERNATFVQSELAKIGVELALEAMPLRVLFGKMRERTHAPLTLFAWRSGPDWDASAMLHSGGAQNYGGYRDEEMDRLIVDAKRQVDRAAWSRALAEVDRRYNARLPTVPLLFRQAVSVRPIALEGWTPTGSSTPVTWNAERWKWSSGDHNPPSSGH